MPADTQDLNPQLRQAIEALVKLSGGRITINSGYRTEAQQAALYKADPQLAAPPGHSNHEKGLAVDLGGDVALAHQLAPRLGLTFPMSWEPWHVELAGTHAQASPGAYTPSPFGDPSPTNDPLYTAQPDHVIATGVQAIRNLAMQTPGEGALNTPDMGVSGSAQGGQTGQAPSAAASYSTTPGQGQGGQIKPADLYKELRGQGVDPVHAAALVSIAGRESGFNPSAYNGNVATGDNSHGLFQINTLGGQHSQYDLASVPGQVSAAADMVKNGGLQPWGPYKGVSWANGTDLATGAEASGGEVSLQQLQAITNEGLK